MFKTISENHIKYLLVFLLLAISCCPFFMANGFYILIAVLLLRFKKLEVRFLPSLVIVLAAAFEFYHNYNFHGYELWVTRQIIFYFFVAMLVAYYVKLEFLPIYINIIYFFTLISFPFFLLVHINSGLAHTVSELFPKFFTRSIGFYDTNYDQINPIVYNFDVNYFYGRNNGPFWEPTVFATLLVIAQMFNLFTTRRLFNKKGIVFSLGILTTLSTTCFIAYFLLIVSYCMLSENIKPGVKIALVFFAIAGGAVLFNKAPFLREKINSEIDGIDEKVDKYGGDSRLASAILDIKEITQKDIYVLWGKGSSRNIRIGGIDKTVLRNCGDTALLVEWGIFYFIFYFGLMFNTFFQLAKYFKVSWIYAIVFVVIFLFVGFSEVFFDLPFFLGFLFLGFIAYNYNHATSKDSELPPPLANEPTPHFPAYDKMWLEINN